ncbi:MAG: hypothetical protein DRO39_08825 [Thermoprotei archaeon]|mgnify:CR=1 FL=1|nr:MAG: hypothetical protein DRO39_08825 [Thermoprotei archaeon]
MSVSILKPEEELKSAISALSQLPEEAQKAVSEFAVMASINIPEDQRDLVMARLIKGAVGALPTVQRELKVTIDQFIRPTKMVSGKFTIVDLRPELFGLTTFRYNWAATGEQSCPWNVTTDERIVMVIVGFQNPEPSPKTRYVYGKIGVDDLPIYYVGDLEGFRVKVLPQPYILKPRSSIELKQYIEAAGYDELKPFGAAFLPADLATKLTPFA